MAVAPAHTRATAAAPDISLLIMLNALLASFAGSERIEFARLFRQREGHVGTLRGWWKRWKARGVPAVGGCDRHQDVLSSASFVRRRHAIGCSRQREGPDDLSGALVVGVKGLVGSGRGKQQPACSHQQSAAGPV